jgi:hypothetical protein
MRTILAPEPALKDVQRRIGHRLLARLAVHPAACGFERGRSILTNALPHCARPVVVRMDLKDYFASTTAARVQRYFRAVGWNRTAARLLTDLCTHAGGLPQGAPTSPRLSNLLNYRMDRRLSALAAKLQRRQSNPRTLESLPPQPLGPGAIAYTRYADDLTFSFERDDHAAIQAVIYMTKRIVADEGYLLHQDKKLRIMRRHDRQLVTGLVVNDWPTLPRHTRRWLRAVEHHVSADRPATLSPQQLQGWRALVHMIQPRSSHDA